MLQRSRIKDIQRLSHKKFRDEAGEYVVEGPRMVAELLRERRDGIRCIYAVPEWIETNGEALGGLPPERIRPVSQTELEALSSLESPNQVLAIVSKPSTPVGLSRIDGVALALEDIRDPGNMGTLIRTADWFGVTDVVCSPSTVDLYNPKVVQATMGSVFRVRVHEAELAGWLGGLSEIAVLGATLDGRAVHEMGSLRRGVLVIGNEAHGLSEDVLGRCTERVTIPRLGRAESLNASVAAGILLSHLTAV